MLIGCDPFQINIASNGQVMRTKDAFNNPKMMRGFSG